MSEWLDAESHADRALEMFERGQWAEAESELRKALSLNPDQAEWHYNLGLTLEAAARDHEALACYERAIELMPQHVEPLHAAGVVCRRLERHAQAVKWFDRALALDAKNEAAYAQKIDALVRLGQVDDAITTFYLAQQATDQPSATCFAAVAEALIEKGEWPRAAWCLREALRIQPQMPRLRARLAFVLSRMGKPQQALQMYLGGLRDDPGNLDTLLDYGELLVELGRLSEASEKFRRVLEIEPANVDAHFRLGQIALDSGRFEQAHLEFELVLKLDGTFPGIRQSLAMSLLRRDHTASARRVLRDELDAWEQDDAFEEAAEPTSGLVIGGRIFDEWMHFGRLLLDAGMPVEAGRVLGHVMPHRSDDPTLLRLVAVARFRGGDVDGGVTAARRALRFDPTCVVSMHNLALTALNAGQIQVAAGWVARGLRVNRHDVDLRRLRMRVWLAWGAERLRQSVRPLGGRRRTAE